MTSHFAASGCIAIRVNTPLVHFDRMNQALCVWLTTPTQQNTFFWGGSSVCKFRQAGPPQRVDCLTSTKNESKVPFLRTQRRIACAGIEPGSVKVAVIAGYWVANKTGKMFFFFLVWKTKKLSLRMAKYITIEDIGT